MGRRRDRPAQAPHTFPEVEGLRPRDREQRPRRPRACKGAPFRPGDPRREHARPLGPRDPSAHQGDRPPDPSNHDHQERRGEHHEPHSTITRSTMDI